MSKFILMISIWFITSCTALDAAKITKDIVSPDKSGLSVESQIGATNNKGIINTNSEIEADKVNILNTNELSWHVVALIIAVLIISHGLIALMFWLTQSPYQKQNDP